MTMSCLDEGSLEETTDRRLIKQIVLVAAGALVIIGLAVLTMYLI